MSEPVIKKKVVETEVVELTIELDKTFFDNMEKAKKQVAEQRGYDVTYGEYIQEAMDDMVKIIAEYEKVIRQQSAQIEYQQGLPQVVEREPEPGEKVPEEPAEPAPEAMYGHISKDAKDDPMFG